MNLAGNKVNNVDVVYTPWQNLKKTASMDVGQVGFYNSKMVSFIMRVFYNIYAGFSLLPGIFICLILMVKHIMLFAFA